MSGAGDDRGRAVSRRRFMLFGSSLAGAAVAGALPRNAWPAAPSDPGGSAVLDVRDFGAAGDGRSDDTRALQRAIDAAAGRGGAVVRLAAGTWRSGTVQLRRRVTVDLTPGAVLLASPDDGAFAPQERLPFRTGSDAETSDFAHALIAGRDLERVAITGGGVIDMNRTRRSGPKPIALKGCRFVTVRGITIVHAPNYGVSLGGCDDVLLDGVTVREAYSDGIDPDCCRRVTITNCDVESDDDALCLKASLILGTRRATEDVIVSNCRLRSPSNCFKLGTESSGDFRRIVLSNCILGGVPRDGRNLAGTAEGGGIAILTVDGGTVDGVTIANVVMSGVPAPLFIRLGNRGRGQAEAVPGRLRNVSISAVVATGASGTGSITGIPGHPVEGVTIDNVRITTAGAVAGPAGLRVPEREDDYPKVAMFGTLPAFGLYLRHARDIVLRNLQMPVEGADTRAALVAEDVVGLRLAAFVGGTGNAVGPVVWLHDVRDAMVDGSLAPEGAGVFVRISGQKTRDVTLVGNVYRTPAPVDLAPELTPGAVMQIASRT